ncbi:putative late blight resistance protein homolog R1B-17 [Coffea eugenioides]|uniref:putative late blight resistance protein homolog R1B-17 n=1 Tax=Coffea eugenioides TaxID=49369 RepID=UPI000F61137B|nr:putative late blight resistance protein homolog R1B-17 [Coffea eugenioides]
MPSQVSAPVFYEHPVGLEDELETIIDRLVRGTMQLDIVPVVGMPGLGKTTLANSVYCHRSVDSHFHIRAWCCVSRVYSKKSLLLQILHNPAFEIFDQSLEINEDDLAENLYKLLKGKRYLIILYDVWDIKAWKLLERSLPDDSNGSRILLTSRSHDLLLDFTLFGKPHHLRPLSDEESWALLQKKIFGKEVCPPGLGEVGFRIAKSCKGLPLAVVLIAGILANTKLHCTIWEKFAESLISSIAKTEECMNTLEQSYRQLPEYLKPCLLYFSAFQEDQDIPVRRLLWLWIYEGFVQKTEEKSLEDVAEDYLMDLIGRSLVMVTKQRSIGGAKTCRLHDLVREFCLEKAKEESFLQILNGGNDLSTFTGPCPHRLCIYLTKAEELERSRMLFPRLRCLLFFLHCAHWNSVKDPDGSLWFIADVVLPNTLWNIKTLRHLQITGSLQLGFSLPIGDIDVSENLYHLDTFCCALDCSDERLQKILKKLPSIRRLKCVGLKYPGYVLKLDSLSRLESLKLHYFFRCKFELPINLKKLILSYNRQPWSEISTIGKLSNLEVLKLGCNSFVGEKWEMQEGEFPNLRFLKLSRLDIRSWTAVSDNFSRLEKLVLHGCVELQEVPSCLEESSTIKTIEVQFGRKSLISSVKQIQQEQMDLGYSDLKIRIQVKRNAGGGGDAAVGARTAASPRARSPARGNVKVLNESQNQNQQQPMSLSRSNSRKAEHSPYRRNPSSEIDTNVVAENMSLPGSKAPNSIITQAPIQKPNSDYTTNNKFAVQGAENKISSSKGIADHSATNLNLKNKEQQHLISEVAKAPQAITTTPSISLHLNPLFSHYSKFNVVASLDSLFYYPEKAEFANYTFCKLEFLPLPAEKDALISCLYLFIPKGAEEWEED